MKRIRVLFVLFAAVLTLAACTRLNEAPKLSAAAVKGSLPSYTELQTALKSVVSADPSVNGGFGLQMWATTLDRNGVVRAVTYSGLGSGEQWLGSRVISAVKANTANAFSLPGLSLSTANLYSATQPGGSLYGLTFTNPVATNVAYGGNAKLYGTKNDPMVGKKIGGINVFGGGLALYNGAGAFVGALGVSGDSSCADHNVAWKLRDALGLDFVPAGVSQTRDDNIVYDIVSGTSVSGWGHPECSAAATAIAQALSNTHPLGGLGSKHGEPRSVWLPEKASDSARSRPRQCLRASYFCPPRGPR